MEGVDLPALCMLVARWLHVVCNGKCDTHPNPTHTTLQALVRLPNFLPIPLPNGRLFSTQSFLGPFFALTAVPDPVSVSFTQPNIVATYFHGAETRSQQDLHNSMNSLRVLHKQLYGELHQLVQALLKNKVFGCTGRKGGCMR